MIQSKVDESMSSKRSSLSKACITIHHSNQVPQKVDILELLLSYQSAYHSSTLANSLLLGGAKHFHILQSLVTHLPLLSRS